MKTNLIIAALSALVAATPVMAEQRLYSRYDIFTIYEEDNGCVAYADYSNDTMLRLSYRPDQGRIYFNAVNPAWSKLARVQGRDDVMVTLMFDPSRSGYSMQGRIIENGGRWGIAGGDTPDEEFLDRMAASSTVTIKLQIGGEQVSLGQMSLGDNPREAVAQIRRCNARRGNG